MNNIIDNLKSFGAVTDGIFYDSIGSDDLYISCLDAFSLDDRHDKLFSAVAAHNTAPALKIARSLLDSVQKLDLPPLISAMEMLCSALDTGSPSTVESALNTYKCKLAEFRKALSCG